jgi:hypothetical protein
VAVGLRFKRVGVKGGSIVLYIKVMQPIQLMEHESRSEANSAPVFQVPVYPKGLLSEHPMAVYRHFKAATLYISRNSRDTAYPPSGMKLNEERKPHFLSSSISSRHFA